MDEWVSLLWPQPWQWLLSLQWPWPWPWPCPADWLILCTAEWTVDKLVRQTGTLVDNRGLTC